MDQRVNFFLKSIKRGRKIVIQLNNFPPFIRCFSLKLAFLIQFDTLISGVYHKFVSKQSIDYPGITFLILA